jgi:hypothetical protein
MQGENALVYTSMALLVCLAIVANFFNATAYTKIFSKDQPKYFDKTRFPIFFTALGISAVCLLIYALFFTNSAVLILQFVFGNLFFVAVAGVALILYKDKDTKQ